MLDYGTGGGGGDGDEYRYDMATCRLMAREYAPQCCNKQADLPMLSEPSQPDNRGSRRNLRRPQINAMNK